MHSKIFIGMDSKVKIASFGEIVWDVYGDAKALGGAPLNFAYYCGKSGADARLVSAVGADEYGREALEVMRQKGISDAGVSVLEGLETGRVMVGVNASGQPQYDIVSPAAWDFISLSPSTLEFASKADAVAFGTLAQRGAKSRASLHALLGACQQKCLKVLDINLRQNFYSHGIVMSSLELANVLKINDEELPLVASMFAIGGSQLEMAREIFCRFNLSYLLLTRGADGHAVIGRDLLIESPAKKAEVVDTVGAGDAFTATFITKILECADPREASEAASETAARVVSQRGALQ